MTGEFTFFSVNIAKLNIIVKIDWDEQMSSELIYLKVIQDSLLDRDHFKC